MMVLRTSRAPRTQAGQVGDRRVRNRASPFFALNAARTGASVDAAVRSVSGARAVGCAAEPDPGVPAGWSVVDFFDSHPRSEAAKASARAWQRMPEEAEPGPHSSCKRFCRRSSAVLTFLDIRSWFDGTLDALNVTGVARWRFVDREVIIMVAATETIRLRTPWLLPARSRQRDPRG